jgi:hypothetical protein
VIDIEADDIAICIKIDNQALDNLACFRSRRVDQLDIEAVGFRVVVQLRGTSSRKLRSSSSKRSPD